MSLADCFRKAGKALSSRDRELIENYVDQGMSEAEAVDAALADMDAEIQSVTDSVTDQGGEVLYQGGGLSGEVDALSRQLEQDLGLESLFLSLKRNGDLAVDNIVVPKDDQKQGKGTKAMEAITQFADQNGLRVVLSPALPDDRKGTTSRARLVKFYKRFGFVENKGRNKDFTISEGMYREPADTLYQQGDITETAEFKAWFGDSKVVDENGKPLVVYHGTGSQFESFDPSHLGKVTDAGSARNAFFFTSDKATAKAYSVYASEDAAVAEALKKADEAEARGDWDEYDKYIIEAEKLDTPSERSRLRSENARVLEVYLSAADVLEVDAEGKTPQELSDDSDIDSWLSEVIEQAQSENRAGVIIRNLDDAVGMYNRPSDHFIVFDPAAIKSTENRGTFDRADANIYNQAAYHGTPHSFDKFSLEAIGTGEGAQAYGWGLYFAGDRGIAEWYRDSLSKGRRRDQVASKLDIPVSYESELFVNQLESNDGDIGKTLQHLKGYAESFRKDGDNKTYEQLMAFHKLVSDKYPKGGKLDLSDSFGSLYQVDLPEDNELLDWDATYDSQPASVKKALKKGGIKPPAKPKAIDDPILRSIVQKALSQDAPENVGLMVDNDYDLYLQAKDYAASRGIDTDETVLGEFIEDQARDYLDALIEIQSFTGEKIYRQLIEQSGSDKGASEFLDYIGIKGLRYLDANSRTSDEESHNYVIWDESVVTVEAVNDELREAEEYLQSNRAGPRGYFNRTTNTITLTPRANLSTFLHESGHFFLEVMRDLAPSSPEIQADLQTLDAWWASQKATDDRKKHELFASGFESYLMEGKAPTNELQGIFNRFRRWLVMIYKKIDKVFASNDLEGSSISPEVKDVMDRLLATQEEIDAANAEQRYGPLPVEQLGLNPEEAASYQKLVDEATEEAETNLTAEVMREAQRERERWWKEGVSEFKEQIAEQVAGQQVYQARDFLSGDVIPEGMRPAKLDRNYIRDIYGKQAAKKLGRMSSQSGVHPDQIASMFGYTSGGELITELLSSMNKAERNAYINAQAQAEMKAKHGDMLNDGSIEQQAQQEVHNNKQAERLLAELRWLNRAAKNKQTPRQYFKAAAEEQIRSTPIDEVRPDIHRRNEVKARNAALKAATEGDYKTAAMEQHKALRQFYLYREAVNAKSQAEKHRKRLAQIQKTKYSARKVHPDYLQQLKVLVAAYDMRKSAKDSDALLNRVNKFIEAQKGTNPDLIAGDVLNSIQSWRQMSLDDLKSVRDAAENLLKIGKKNSEEAREIERLKLDEITESIKENTRKPKQVSDSDSFIAKAKRGKEQFSAAHRKLESLLQEADGWDDKGILQNEIFRKLWDAQITEMDRLKSEHDQLNDLFEGFDYLFNGLKNSLKDIEATQKYVDLHDMRVGTPETGTKIRKMTRGERIVLALNWGNEGNREAIRTQENREMLDAEVERAISTLTPDELQLVNRIWEYVDKFYPELAKVEQEATGIAPAKVEASPFVVNGVSMRGGYYPLQADTALDWKAEMHAVEERAQKLMNEGGAMRSSTKHGSTIERIGFGRQAVNLSIDGLFKHVDGVVHDITHRQPVIEADRILRDKGVRAALTESIGAEGYKAVNLAITRLAAGSSHPSDLAILNKLMRWSRVAASYGAMGYSARTAIINVTGLIPAIPEVGKLPLASALMREIKAPLAMRDSVFEKSTMMENRAQTITRDVYETLRNMKGNKKWNSFKAHAFWMISQVDGFVSRAVWTAAYDGGIQKGMSEKDAIYHADRTVQRTQGSGIKIDLSAVEDQNEIYRALSPMYTYFNAVLNLGIRQKGKMDSGKMSKREYAEAMMWMFIAVPIAEWLLFGDDEEEAAEALPKEVASYYLGQWFGIRELSSYVKYGQFFETPLQRTMGAVPAAMWETGELAFLEDSEFDKGSVKKYTDVLPVLGFPSGAQINRTVRYLMDLEDQGGDLSPYGLLVTGKHDSE